MLPKEIALGGVRFYLNDGGVQVAKSTEVQGMRPLPKSYLVGATYHPMTGGTKLVFSAVGTTPAEAYKTLVEDAKRLGITGFETEVPNGNK